MKTIHIDLSSRSSVSNAINELNNIKKEWQRKSNLCAEMIAAALADEIQKNLDAIPFTDDIKDVKTHSVVPKNTVLTATAVGNRIVINGEEVAFVEFGAGAYYNGVGSKNPLSDAVSFDTATGTYGKGQGSKKFWFIAHNRISCGTPAYMPIYNAIEAIKPQIPTMIRQVFV